MRDWHAWHQEYDDPASSLSRRLEVVRHEVGRALSWLETEGVANPHVVSMCAGDGRDLLPVLAGGHPTATATLVELDPELAARAREDAETLGLRGIDVRTADAGAADSYRDAVPADLLMACGVFGNVHEGDVVPQAIRDVGRSQRPVRRDGHRIPLQVEQQRRLLERRVHGRRGQQAGSRRGIRTLCPPQVSRGLDRQQAALGAAAGDRADHRAATVQHPPGEADQVALHRRDRREHRRVEAVQRTRQGGRGIRQLVEVVAAGVVHIRQHPAAVRRGVGGAQRAQPLEHPRGIRHAEVPTMSCSRSR